MAWLAGWTYRKSVTLSRASGAVSNYQMKILVGESSGATGEDVDCAAHVQTDFDDLRFTTSDETTLLDYWIESIAGATPNQLATVWVEFNSIGTGATTFYMYYGKADATAASSGADTFIVFDNFERGSDGDTIGGSWTETVNHVHISTDHAYSGTRCGKWVGNTLNAPGASIPVTASDNIAIRYRLWKEESAIWNAYHGDATHLICIGYDAAEDIEYFNGSWNDTGSNITKNQWELVETADYRWGASPTLDVWHNEVKICEDQAVHYNSGSFNNVFLVYQPGATGEDGYIDDFIVRNYRTTEPAFGSWGSEESAVTGNPYYFANQ